MTYRLADVNAMQAALDHLYATHHYDGDPALDLAECSLFIASDDDVVPPADTMTDVRTMADADTSTRDDAEGGDMDAFGGY